MNGAADAPQGGLVQGPATTDLNFPRQIAKTIGLVSEMFYWLWSYQVCNQIIFVPWARMLPWVNPTVAFTTYTLGLVLHSNNTPAQVVFDRSFGAFCGLNEDFTTGVYLSENMWQILHFLRVVAFFNIVGVFATTA